jgi:hypothetical protein
LLTCKDLGQTLRSDEFLVLGVDILFNTPSLKKMDVFTKHSSLNTKN